MNVDEKLAAARLIVRRRARFFVPMLVKLVPRWSDELEASGIQMGVTRNGILLLNRARIESDDVEDIATGLVHECGHLWGHHAQRADAIVDCDRAAWNLAGDRAINGPVRECGFRLLPTDALGKDLDMPEGLTANEYYAAAKQRGETAPQSEGSKPQRGHGGAACGSCAGHALADEPTDGSADPDARGDSEIERAARAVSEAMASAPSQGQGSCPGSWRRMAEEHLGPAKVPWRSVLRQFATRALTFRPSGDRVSYHAPSRFQGGIGFGAGRPVLPNSRATTPRVTVLVDTSGSMSEQSLGAIVSEIDGIISRAGAKCRVLVVDAAVHAATEVRRARDVLPLLKGGGGSDFRPAFAQALDGRAPRPDAIIACTDGYIAVPDADPGVPTFWVLTGGKNPPAKWGTSIVIDD